MATRSAAVSSLNQKKGDVNSIRGALRSVLPAVWFVVSGFGIGMAVSVPATADAQAAYQFNLPAQALADSLRTIARVTSTNILFAPETVGDRKAPEVKGSMTASAAIEKVLAGSGLQVKQSADAILVTKPGAKKTLSTKEGGSIRLAQSERASSAGSSALAADDSASMAAAETSAASGESATSVLQEVIVSAQKREEHLKDVPISISVMNGGDLDQSTAASMNEALRTVPGIASYEFAQGAGMTKFSVRGVTSNDSIFNGSATVGYYLDEIPFAFIRFPVSPDVNAFDLARVEVLRGPQGTLYGANALNGVIRVMTQDADLSEPKLTARTTFSSTAHGGDNYRADGALSMPLIPGKLAVRAVAGYADYSGWIDQPFTGRQDVNDMKQKNLRLKVNAAPTEKLGVELLSWFSRDDRGSHSTAQDNRTTTTTFPEDVESRIDAFGMTLTYELPSVSILSSTSYVDFSGSTLQDFPLGLDMTVTALTGKLLSEELRINSSSEGPWKWSLGGIYRDEEDSSLQDLLRNTIPSLSGISENVYESSSFALYGEISRSFADSRWEVTAGLRYFEDESTSDELRTLNPADRPFGRSEETLDAVTPRVVLSYRPADAVRYYASYSEGFRSGFTQNGQVLRLSGGLSRTVAPDRLTNYEVGTKGSALAGRFNYEIAAYYITWRDAVQVLTVPIPNTTASWNGAINSKGIDGFGADVAFGLRVKEGLELGATVSWNELGFTDNVRSGTTLVYADGDRPASSPKMNASAYVTYDRPIGAGYSVQFGGSAGYTTKMPGTYAAGTRMYGDDVLLARASVGLLAPAGWSARLFVDNLTDENGRIRAASISTPGASDRSRPRTVGLQLDYRF